jgi:hypothetical protein
MKILFFLYGCKFLAKVSLNLVKLCTQSKLTIKPTKRHIFSVRLKVLIPKGWHRYPRIRLLLVRIGFEIQQAFKHKSSVQSKASVVDEARLLLHLHRQKQKSNFMYLRRAFTYFPEFSQDLAFRCPILVGIDTVAKISIVDPVQLEEFSLVDFEMTTTGVFKPFYVLENIDVWLMTTMMSCPKICWKEQAGKFSVSIAVHIGVYWCTGESVAIQANLIQASDIIKLARRKLMGGAMGETTNMHTSKLQALAVLDLRA